MVEDVDCFWSLISILLDLYFVLQKKTISIILRPNNPSPLSWRRTAEPVSVPRPRDGDAEAKDGAVNNMHDEAKEEEMVRVKGLSIGMIAKAKIVLKAKKRPASLIVSGMGAGPCDQAGKEKGRVDKDVEIEEREYSVASRKGCSHPELEDGYGVITNINGDSKQAFFGVFDGHGGCAAVDFVSDKLGKNIISAIAELKEEEVHLDTAIKTGYLATDTEFVGKGLRSGACAATVLLKDGELHVANVGDCRVVMSRKGVANALTSDHRAGRADERIRIETAGGFVNCRSGVWRVLDTLAVSRAIGDANLKEWVISEPEMKKLRLSPDCEFLIMASDGLWDKVSNQEAVDLVSKNKNSMKSCKDLVELSLRRGSRDDITVMVVDLQAFVYLS